MKVIENIKMIITAMARLLTIIMAYTSAVVLALFFGGAMFIFIEKVCSRLAGFSIVETIKPLIVWIVSHINIAIPVIIVLFVFGFIWFLYKFAKIMTNNFTNID